jgi:hypothetical protein
LWALARVKLLHDVQRGAFPDLEPGKSQSVIAQRYDMKHANECLVRRPMVALVRRR